MQYTNTPLTTSLTVHSQKTTTAECRKKTPTQSFLLTPENPNEIYEIELEKSRIQAARVFGIIFLIFTLIGYFSERASIFNR